MDGFLAKVFRNDGQGTLPDIWSGEKTTEHPIDLMTDLADKGQLEPGRYFLVIYYGHDIIGAYQYTVDDDKTTVKYGG